MNYVIEEKYGIYEGNIIKRSLERIPAIEILTADGTYKLPNKPFMYRTYTELVIKTPTKYMFTKLSAEQHPIIWPTLTDALRNFKLWNRFYNANLDSLEEAIKILNEV